MMRKLATFLLPLFLFSFFTIQAQVIFEDGFESGTLSKWIASGDTLVSTVSPSEGSYCFQGTNAYQLEKTFSPVSEDIITVEFAMKAAQDNKECIDFLIYDENDLAITRIYFAPVYIKAKNGVNDVDLKSYTWDTWYQTKIIIDQVNRQYDILIDGDTLGQNFDYVEGEAGYASRFYFSGSETDGSVGFLDDVSIASDNYILYDDFNDNLFNTSLWTKSGFNSSYVNEQNQQMELYNVLNGGGGTNSVTANAFGSIDPKCISMKFIVTNAVLGASNYTSSIFFQDGNNTLQINHSSGDFTINDTVECICDEGGSASIQVNGVPIKTGNGYSRTDCYVSWRVWNADCKLFFDEVYYQVSNEPLAAVFYASDTLGSVSHSVKFFDQSTGLPTSWEWDFNGDDIVDATDQNPIHTYDIAGDYTVKLTVSDGTDNDQEVKTSYISVTEANNTYVFDDFDDNLIDETIWRYNTNNGGSVSEGGGQMLLNANSGTDSQVFLYSDVNSGNSFKDVQIEKVSIFIDDMFKDENSNHANNISLYDGSSSVSLYSLATGVHISGQLDLVLNHNAESVDVYLDGTEVNANVDVSSLSEYYLYFYVLNQSSPISYAHLDSITVTKTIAESNNEKDALMALYNATDGDNWTDNTNWGSEEPLGDWYGVTTDIDGFVTELDLELNNLVGTLPSELGSLSALQLIWMQQNQISGSIPPELGNLTSLVDWRFGSNQLSGSIPVEFGNLTNLEYFSLSTNQITGSIPSELGNLTSLEFLNLGSNQLSGQIPAEIGNIISLTDLTLNSNQLTSSIPSEFGNLVNLEWLYLSYNQLDSVPENFANLNMQAARCESNLFTFEDIQNLPSMAVYDPQKTIHIYDTAHLEAGVEGLIQLSFDGNVNNSTYNWYRDGQFMSSTSGNSIQATEGPGTAYFSLEITNAAYPDFILNIDSVVVITSEGDLERQALMAIYNATAGESWTDNTNWGSEEPLGNWYGVTTNGEGHVTGISMTDNNLNGVLPSDIEDLTYLTNMRLDGHQLSGSIPAELYAMPNLVTVNLSNNQISGSLSPLIGSMPAIENYIVYNNQLTGAIPSEIGNSETLTNLDIGDQSLSGEIPVELGLLTNLTYLALRGTDLTGGIPNEICNLENLQYLYLDQNELSGEIPADIGLLSGLINLWIDNNNLTGSLPTDIVASMPNLVSFVFNSNKFDEIPEDFQFFGAESVPAENNDFTFEDLQNLPQVATYDPQNTINIYDTIYLETGVTGTIELSFDGNVIGSSYDWYIDNNFQATTTGNSILATLSPAGTFYFNLEITNINYQGFTLDVDSVVVIVEDGGPIMQNFDEYNSGEYIAVVSDAWDTWSGQTGGSEDALITDAQASSLPNSVVVEGSSDIIFRTGNKTTGRHEFNLSFMVPTGNTGYFNFQHSDTPGESFAIDCNFNPDGTGVFNAGGTTYNFNYSSDLWNELKITIDLENDWAKFELNEGYVCEWQWSLTTNASQGIVKMGMIDFYANATNGTPLMYIDDLFIEELDPLNCTNIGLVGTFNNWGSEGDHALIQSTENPHNWYSEIDLVDFSEIKIRQNEDWTVNWGAEDFPIGWGYQEGPNIQVPAGNYLVHFNCESGYYNFENPTERNALLALYNATDGDNWSINYNWNTDEAYENWYGLATNEEGEVDTLWITNNNLNGSIPDEIEDLTELKALVLSGNSISGSIPSTIGNLSNLNRLSISQCQLTGGIPPEIGNLSNLSLVALWQNQLSGDIPDEFWSLPQLEFIYLGNNSNLGGTLPIDFGGLTTIKHIWIDGTSLQGGIPNSIGSLEQLEVLNLSDNYMDGYLPASISTLSNLTDLNLSGNNFYGELEEFEPPYSLTSVLVSGNKLDNIQSLWQNMILDTLNVQNNQFSFEDLLNLPAYAVYNPQDTIHINDTTYLETGVTGLIELDFDNTVNDNSYDWYREGSFMSTTSGNSIMATENEAGTTYFIVEASNPGFPNFNIIIDSIVVITEDPDAQRLALIALYDATDGDNWTDNTNWKTDAPLDQWFGVSTEGEPVTNLNLVDNNLNGYLPIEIGDLVNLRTFELSSNNLTGSIPSEIGNMTSLEVLNLDNNSLSGQLPNEIGDLVNVYYLYISNNNLDGALPATLGNMIALIRLQLDENTFTGNIPIELADLPELQRIWLNGNDLSGEIPVELFSSSSIQYIRISDNNLTGNIPSEVGNLSTLYYFYADGNELTGVIPETMGNALNIRDIRIQSNQLSGPLPASIASLPELFGIYAWGNNIDFIPEEFSSLDMAHCGFDGNKLTFDDVVNLPTVATYSGQQIVEITDTLFLENSTPQTYLLNFDQNVANSSYQWFRDGVPFDVTTTGSLEINETPNGQTHYYYVQVSNTAYPNLTLTTDSLVVETENCQLSLEFTSVDIACFGDASGSIDLTASNGQAPYEYSIDEGSNYQTSGLFENLNTGTYYASAKDAIGCETDLTEVIILEPEEVLSFTATPIDLLCSGDATGEISFSASGGTSPYEYSIDNGESWQANTLFAGLIAGDYEVSVRDGNQCQVGDIVTINEPTEGLSIVVTPTDVLCNSDESGMIEIVASGGTAPYEYSIDNGESWQADGSFTDLLVGDYEVMVRDENGCTSGDLVTISEPIEALSFIATPTDVFCSGDVSGEIDIVASGGTAPYEYSIDNGSTYQTTALFTGLTAGDFDVMVRDDNQCQAGDIVTINEPTEGLSIVATPTDVLCYGDVSGTIEIEASGGTATYEYSIDNGESWQTSDLYTGLIAGDYEVSVRDGNQCQTGDIVTINEPTEGLSIVTTPTEALCNGDASGTIEIEASGGTAPYEYSIDNGENWQASNLFTALAADEYEVSVRDANECSSSELVSVNEPEESISFTFEVIDVVCAGESTGEIAITASGGTPDYEYSIDNGENWQASNVFIGLTAGVYEVIVRDANACSISELLTVNSPEESVSFTSEVTDVACAGESTGEMVITGNGGTPDYEYSIDNGENWQASNVFIGLAAGDYGVSIRDANACSSSGIVSVGTPESALTFVFSVTDVACFGGSNGKINFEAEGGSPPYSYSIDGGLNWISYHSFNNLSAGEYQLAVSDNNACISEDLAIISQPESELNFTVDITDLSCFETEDGIIEINATGGTPAYEYSINGGDDWQESNMFGNLVAGAYDIRVKDANDCEAESIETINQPEPLPEISFTGLNEIYCTGAEESLLTGSMEPDGVFSGPGITDNSNGTAFFNPDLAGIGGPYEIVYTYTNSEGCSVNTTQETSVTETSIISFSGLQADYCLDAAASTLIGSEAPLGSFSGIGITDNNDGTAVFMPGTAGVGGPYEIVYEFTNEAGCVSMDTLFTSVNALPNVDFDGLEASTCLGDMVTLTGNYAPDGDFSGPGVTDLNNGTAFFNPDLVGAGGPYTIVYSYTNSEGCSNSTSQQTSVYEVPIVSFDGLELNYCEGASEILITGSEAPNGIFSGPAVFDQGDGTAYFYPVVAGVGGPYSIIYSFESSGGCIGTESQETTVLEMPIVSFTDLEDGYCQTNSAIVLTGNYAPEGSFTGEGIIDNGDGTALFDPAIIAVGGPYEIKYEYETPEGCGDSEIQEVEIYQVDELSFEGLSESYCANESAIAIIGSMAPVGSFTGVGITDNGDGTALFSPEEAGVGGPYDILYFYTNENSCYSETMESTTVNLIPIISFTGLGSTYCINSEPIVLAGNQPSGSFSGPGIVDNGDGTAIFTPSAAGAGANHEIVYSITSNEGCYAEDVQQVNVEALQELSFDGLESDYCFSNPASVITGNMAPLGTFIGQGITDNGDGTAVFDPQIAGIGGPYIITYEYQTGVCTNSFEQEVIVHNSTAVSFTGLAETYCHVNTEFVLTGSEAPSGYFTGEGISDNGDGTASLNPSILGSGGPFMITYHFENENGCISYVEGFTNIVDGPIASFDYSLGGCVEDALLIDQSTSPNGSIVNWDWNFDDPESGASNTSDDQNPLHQFVSNQSSFNIKLLVADEQGCLDSIVQLIEPFSTSTITGHVYSSDGTDITDGYVKVYLLSNGILSTQVDSVQIAEDGSFTCLEMATCVDYIFRAYANEMEYPGVMPRWHIDAYFWLDATPISLNWDDILVENIDINLYQVPAPPEGTSGVSGGVYLAGGKGEPVKNVDVVLEFDAADDKGDEVVGYKPTDALGHWEFDKLGDGIFKISLDIPGLNFDSVYTVTISAPNTNITNLDYYIDPEHGIYMAPTGLDELDDLGFGSIGVFPNPNTGQFYLEIIKSEDISRLNINAVQLWDMEGRLIKDLGIKFKGDHYLSHLNLSDIQPGMYFIKVKNKEEFGVVKFVIQR